MNRITWCLGVACVVVLESCGGGGSGVGGGSFVLVHAEREPNDDPWNADFVSSVLPGDDVVVLGRVGDSFPDAFDGFAFHAPSPCEIHVALAADNPYADLDLAVYDPVLGDYAVVFETVFNPEAGSFAVFSASTDFQLVVYGFAGSSSYDLSIDVLPLGAAASTARPGEGSLRIAAMGKAAGFPSDRATKPGSQAKLESYRAGTGAIAGDRSPLPRGPMGPLGVRPMPVVRGALVEVQHPSGQAFVRRFVATPGRIVVESESMAAGAE